eukprot:TRINITY_DN19632_c0_g1_i1.p1 TRINITY_DN19632_c0_g1~~TRINITY_DN19632_c0_g1_i1.p1  ORF type:complete len:383 (+),score=52.12 TRINITY_DN19632_c0_g1_i1:40-1149(+)
MACCDVAHRRLSVLKTHVGEASTPLMAVRDTDIERFKRQRKIDAHVHHNVEGTAFANAAKKWNFSCVQSINADIDLDEWPYIAEQKRLALEQRHNNVEWITTFTCENFDQPGWSERVIASIKKDISLGANGVKVWKNIGMEIKKPDGTWLMISDPVFDPIFAFLAKQNVTLVGHCGEPKNCWLPVEQMTVNNDREYFSTNRKYHMFHHPELPSYEAQIQARDDMLEKNPTLKFMGCHLGSLEWSVVELGRRLTKFPNMSVDFAHRMCHLQHQASRDYEQTRQFFIDYQDQLVYGTDLMFFKGDSDKKIADNCEESWLSDWLFLSTSRELTCPEVNGTYKGLNLPDAVLDKVYWRNAIRWFPKMAATLRR